MTFKIVLQDGVEVIVMDDSIVDKSSACKYALETKRMSREDFYDVLYIEQVFEKEKGDL